MTTVRVRRSGGFIGRTSSGECDLTADDPVAAEVRDLVARVDLTISVSEKPRGADRYVYEFEVDGETLKIHEHELTPDLKRIAALLLK